MFGPQNVFIQVGKAWCCPSAWNPVASRGHCGHRERLQSDFSGLLGHGAYPDAALGKCCTFLVYFNFLH